MRRAVLVIAVLSALPALSLAQTHDLSYVSVPQLERLDEAAPQRAQKSPTLAALLSWFVWPGVGSYYAGNSSHGTRHVVISAVAVGAAIPLLVTCDNDGFCDFDHDGVRLSVVVGLAAALVANSVWSVVTAINDAEDYNMNGGSGGIALDPSVKRLTTPLPDGLHSRFGLQVATLRF